MISKVFQAEDNSWYIEVPEDGAASRYYGHWPNMAEALGYYYKTFYHSYSMVSVDCCNIKSVPQNVVEIEKLEAPQGA